MFEIFERFSSIENRHRHYIKHVIDGKEFGDITEEEYEKLAESLQSSPVDNKNIFGYISDYKGNTSYCKYEKSTGIFVVYYYSNNNEPLTITCYMKLWRKYQMDKAIEYFDEIPQGK